jgi:tetratricopeptide (TPR) repeat protein
LKRLFLVTLVLASCLAFAQETETGSTDDFIEDPTDISAYLERFSEGVPIAADVQQVKQQATAAFEEGNCEEAIPLLEAMAKQSNIMANILRQTLEPFYSGRYDDRENFNVTSVNELIANETSSNSYVQDRNSAWVMLGECELQAGNRDRALGFFSEALDYISLQPGELDNWKRAAQGVMEIVGTSTSD